MLLLPIVYIIINIVFLDLHQGTEIGKGYIFKLSNIIFGLSIYQKIFINFSFLIKRVFLLFTYQKTITNIMLSSYYLMLSIFTWPLLQEYFDPLIFILAFTFLKFDLKIDYKNSIFIFCYMGLFLIACNIYYNNLLN